MAVVIAKSAATLAKALIRRNVAGVIATSTKEMLTQVRIFFYLHKFLPVSEIKDGSQHLFAFE